jgi:3'-phosphoadenosine 5'-phosphosulfate sulfotransferase (PAPS reductase)/FAD synthetase
MNDVSIQRLIDRGALFVVNHSGGKDSQAMFETVAKRVPASQIIAVHAILPEVEWDGVVEHIEATIGDTPLIFARAKKTFFEMVEHRGMFPSPKYRQCTSDLKRNPIEREIRKFLASNSQFGGLIVNCMGMRAEESSGRAKLATLKINPKNSVAGREWYDWLPIHDWLVGDVFKTIADSGQEPHWAYAAGMSRLSCCFCIMANQSDLTTAAKLNPMMYARYVATERRLNFTLSPSLKTLPELTGVAP